MFTDLKRIIDQISRDKGIDRSLLIEAIEDAVKTAALKKLGPESDIEVEYNEELGEVEIFQYRTVVEEIENPDEEILLEEARELDPEVELGEDLGIKMGDLAELGRIAAQAAKQVIIQRMKNAEREVIYEMFKDRVGEVINGIVQRFERGNTIVNLGRTEAILPREEQIPRRSFKQGDRIRAYLKEVRQESRDHQLVLSRSCDEFLVKLFEMEVPEIAEDIVRIMGVAREPGFRAKIAVSSTESDVDPVGACVGIKGSRVQNVVQELQGERIDIVPWSPDPVRYVANALKPAVVSQVTEDADNHSLLVVVPDDQLSLAIGRQGQNVRLAGRLLGWRIDVRSETRHANLGNPDYLVMLQVEGMDEETADRLLAAGIGTVAALAGAQVEDLLRIRGVNEERAQALIDAAAALLAASPLPVSSPEDGTGEEGTGEGEADAEETDAEETGAEETGVEEGLNTDGAGSAGEAEDGAGAEAAGQAGAREAAAGEDHAGAADPDHEAGEDREEGLEGGEHAGAVDHGGSPETAGTAAK